MMLYYFRLIILFLGVLFTQLGYGQRDYGSIPDLPEGSLETEADLKNYRPFQFDLTVKNMHLWRGYRVTDEAMTAANVYYTSRKGKFEAGLWGGVGFAGDYTEFDYYMSYSHNNWTLAIWDINNYTDFPDANIFNYDIGETSHFVDVSLTYRLDPIPLQLSWSTIILGRDTYTTSNGELRNAFTNFVEASYLFVERKDWNLGIYAGAAFSLESTSHFYGEEAGFNNVGVTYSKTITISNSYKLPVAATAMWNDLQDYGALQVAIELF